MPAKQWEITPLFEQFVKDSYKGKRLKSDGKRIKQQTADNYGYVLKLLLGFEEHRQVKIRIKEVSGRNKKEMLEEQLYWNRFYFQFSNYLYDEKGHFDNYADTVIKILRTFFSYLKSYRLLQTGDFYKRFYVCKEEVPIHTLLLESVVLPYGYKLS